MLGVLALVLQVGSAIPASLPAVGPGTCSRTAPASVESRHTFRALVDLAVRWVHGARAAADTACPRTPAVTTPVPLSRPRATALALVRMHPSCDDDEAPDTDKDDQHTLPDWAPPYSSLWIPEPEVQLAAFPMGPECDDSIESALSGGAELALAPRSLSGLLGL